jgi:hypothetical protein
MRLPAMIGYAFLVEIIIQCPCCKKHRSTVVTAVEFDELQNSKKCIQDILPQYTAARRELLVSGTCPRCWIELHGNEK